MKSRLTLPSVNLSDIALLAKGEVIYKGLSDLWAGTDDRPSFVPTLVEIRASLDKYRNAYHAAINHDSLMIQQRKEARAEFFALLEIIKPYVEASVGDDVSKLIRSGFDMRKARSASTSVRSAPLAPATFTVQQGSRRGTLIGSASRQPDAVCFELHVAVGDPTVESNWKFLGVHVRPNEMEINDRESGTLCSFRLRGHSAVGAGDWSLPVSIIPN